ncbi:MAG: bifunctional proline dehydrogenase/L-glutamate gamma-semialdehyde dehydrogenase PutA [Gammaproteobacteria bacterium]|nr:bifunctional proline dehydrogenase/L-glutamate gamma-semialdehyde dehydrogenase PutA [Gammaproteobacteria bacterium]
MIFEQPPILRDANRQAIQKAFLADETQCVEALLKDVGLTAQDQAQVQLKASQLVDTARQQSHNLGGLSAFLQEYDLSSQEGVVLLCLAEALLRIPDAKTADQLIHDKLINANWQQHLGSSQSLFVNASTWGLMLTGRIIKMNEPLVRDSAAGVVNSIVSRISEAVVRAALKEAMRIMGHQFIMGPTIQKALVRSETKALIDNRFSFDMLGEAALSQLDAEKYFNVYRDAISNIAQHTTVSSGNIYDAPSISIKLSALHPRFEFAQYGRVLNELVPKVKHLAQAAQQANIAMTIDAEEADRLEMTLDIVDSILTDKAFEQWPGLGVVVQAYQKRAPFVIDWLGEIVRRTNRRIMVRLVKGAYWDTEIKRAQEQGLAGYPVFTVKKHTDVSYLCCARKLFALGQWIFPQFATHNAHTASAVLQLRDAQVQFEMQRLHGMGDALYRVLLGMEPSLKCRVYAPVGSHNDLLPYLVRRLLENGTNTSFVNRMTDVTLAITEIIADPVEGVRQSDKMPHPNIPLPEAIFKQARKNSRGCNLNDDIALRRLQDAMLPFNETVWHATPIIQGADVWNDNNDRLIKRVVFNPANRHHKVGDVIEAQVGTAQHALAVAHAFAVTWNKVSVTQRAQYLENAANLLEEHQAELITLLIYEAGRCIPDAISEVREAVDFCRYYAMLARKLFSEPQQLPGATGELNTLSLHGRGVFVCISPWNFPLAIFCGQIAAALVTGNCVVAKPARQTPLIAYRAIQLFHQAGIPSEGLQFLPMQGALVGHRLLVDPRVAGVAFTGSTDVATSINVQLAQRGGPIVPLIAETGGQNAMIVDSSALAEQVVQDVLSSAFNSAGQRCSGLRVLFLQEEIAPRVITLIKGAMAELRVAQPHYLSTDIGPVIDIQAQQQLEQHINTMSKEGRLIYRVPVERAQLNGSFVGPCAFEIDHLSQLSKEVFGPVLHVIRYAADALENVLTDINNTQYGLTLGIHSRIQEKVTSIQQAVQVGNIYVNRNMIGAAVGVQPFGGEGLSGSGPKAGGPHYLYRFSVERVLTVNTAAVGGDTTLLARVH